MKKNDILNFDNLADFERVVVRDQKPYDINMMVMPGTLEDKLRNLDPDKGIPALRRQFNLVFLFLGGIHDLYIGTHYCQQLQPNDLVVVPENMMVAAPNVRQCSGYCIHFKTAFLQPLVSGNIATPFSFFDIEADHILHLEPEDSEAIQQIFRDILREYDRFSYEKDYLLRNYIHILLLRIREVYTTRATLTGQPTSRSEKLVNEFKHLVEKHFMEERSVQYYADTLSITPKYLSDAVKAVTGRSPSKLIQERTLLEIKFLLHSSDLTVSQIGQELNFNDQSHLSRFVKQQTGSSPLALRQKI